MNGLKIFHIDFNTAFFRMDYLKGFIRDLRSWGYDALLWELEDFVRWESVPMCRQTDSVGKREFRELLDFARDLGFENIPLLQCLGHCEYVLSHPEYARFADTPGALSPYCPSRAEVREFLGTWLAEYLSLFSESRFFHLGCDEVWHLGEVCPRCKSRLAAGEKGELMAEHINFLARIVRRAGKRPVIWADMLLIHPEMSEILSRDIVLADWRYELRSDRPDLWLWDEKGGRLIDENGITEEMRRRFGKYLRDAEGRINPFYTTDFLLDQGFSVICAGSSSSYPDNFLLGNAFAHIHNCCSMMKKGEAGLGYLHTSWTVHLFPYELQPAIEIVSPSKPCETVMDDYAEKHFGIAGEDFFGALDVFAPRVLFSGAESTGCGKAVKIPPAGIVRQRLREYHDAGILESELARARECRDEFAEAVEELRRLRGSILRGGELFDLYLLAAEALLDRAEFAVLAASEFLGLPCRIGRERIQTELLRLRDRYLAEYLRRQTPEHARRMTAILFDPLLEYLDVTAPKP